MGSITHSTVVVVADDGTSPVGTNEWNAAHTLTNIAQLDVADQTVSGGAIVTSGSQGTKSSGTYTVNCGACPLQYITNNGAFTLAAPANDGSMMLFITNGTSAGTITFSGFTVGSSVGDSLTTTSGNKFTLSIWRINGTSGYRVAAHQ